MHARTDALTHAQRENSIPTTNKVCGGIITTKGYFHLCPRMDFLQTLHINNSLYANYENVFIELDS